MFATTSDSLQRFAAESAAADPGFAIRRGTDGLYELSIGGRFYPGWGGSLANGLALHGVSIVRGFARKVEALCWRAGFELEQTPGGDSPLALDYLELASRPLPARARVPITLDRYELRTSAGHGGCIEVLVEGPDQVGFLGALLKRFAFLALFPEEMAVDTRKGRVHDVFWLKSIGRSVPSDEARSALSRVMRRLDSREPRASGH
jgi:hypothetical protein